MKTDKRNVELTLEKAKEWYQKGGELKEVALQAFKEEELKDNRPRSWEEYCANTKRNRTCFIGPTSDIIETFSSDEFLDTECDRNVLPSKELAEAFLALMQLISLRQAWIGDWEPDWNDNSTKYTIDIYRNQIVLSSSSNNPRPLSFPSEKLAKEFIKCFDALLKSAKGLY